MLDMPDYFEMMCSTMGGAECNELSEMSRLEQEISNASCDQALESLCNIRTRRLVLSQRMHYGFSFQT